MPMCEKHKSFFLKNKTCASCDKERGTTTPSPSVDKDVQSSSPQVVQKSVEPTKPQVVQKIVEQPKPQIVQKIVFRKTPSKEEVSVSNSSRPLVVIKSGVLPESGKSEELTDKPLEPVKVLSNSTEPNKSSAVPAQQMDDFIDGLTQLKKLALGFPLFSVCDNNSFHTTGYLWGLYAVRQLKLNDLPDGPVAVIDFDSHADAGKKSSPFVASDRWGGMLVSSIVKAGYPACYISTFNHPKGTGSCIVVGGGSGSEPKKPSLDAKLDPKAVREAFTTFWKEVADYFGKPVKYVFFTIDRDVLRNSFTQWGDGAIKDSEQLVDLMEAALEPLGILLKSKAKSPAQLIGFDVTGLPESSDLISKPADGWQMGPAVWGAMSKELQLVRAFAEQKLVLAGSKDRLSNVLFFSGSVSYSGPQPADVKNSDCWNFLSAVAKGLADVLTTDWTYLICRQKPPIYGHGWKAFSVYRPTKKLFSDKPGKMKEQLGEGLHVGGFASTASVSSPGVIKPPKILVGDIEGKKGDFKEYTPD